MGGADSYYTNGGTLKALANDLEVLVRKLPSANTLPTKPARTRAKRSIRELRPDELAAIIADYQGGATLSELSTRHGYNRVGISSALKRAGVQLRRQGLNQEQIDQAVNLYRSGMSLARIGDRLEVDATTVRTRLMERGSDRAPGARRVTSAASPHDGHASLSGRTRDQTI